MTTVTVSDEIIQLTAEVVETITVTVAEQGPPGLTGPQGEQGPQGVPGDLPRFTAIAATALGGHRAVAFVGGDGAWEVVYADQSIPEHAERVLGITVGAADQGAEVTIQTGGELTEPSWNWVPDAPVYLATNGLLTQTPPTTGFLQVVGLPLNATTLLIKLQIAFDL